jgi:hypothetical protein
MARLLAKGWIVFCLYAAGHAFAYAVQGGAPALSALGTIGVCALLFAAMGLLFAGGYAVATDHAHGGAFALKSWRATPGFNAIVFTVFVALSFADQVWFAPTYIDNAFVSALKAAIEFAVPGQRALENVLMADGLDGGRIFASAFAWLLAIIYLASAASRLKLAAGLIRLERAKRPEALGASTLALILGAMSVVGIQLLFMGSIFAFLPSSAYTETGGALLIGLAPLMLAYLIEAALANLLAAGPE